MRSIVRYSVLALIVSAFAACAGDQPEEEPAVEETTGEMDGMAGMPGMEMQSGMNEEMAAHMQRMEGMPMDSVPVMLPMHRQMVANMLAQMNREMRDMNMPADASWDATVDSLRADLRGMPEMDADELGALLPAHRRRVMRLMEMHDNMMANM